MAAEYFNLADFHFDEAKNWYVAKLSDLRDKYGGHDNLPESFVQHGGMFYDPDNEIDVLDPTTGIVYHMDIDAIEDNAKDDTEEGYDIDDDDMDFLREYSVNQWEYKPVSEDCPVRLLVIMNWV